MPFHVEVSSSPDRARVFNLDEAQLRRMVLEPWLAGRNFELGEQEWDPRECGLAILEGEAMEAPDLAFGQGWSNALRSAKDVTKEALDAAETEIPRPTAATVEADSLDAALSHLQSGGDPAPIAWSEATERIDGRDPAVAAVILVLRPPAAERPRS